MQADAIFNPPNTRVDTSLKLSKLAQGTLSAEEYFIEFDMLAKTAGYATAHFDEYKIGLANQQLSATLVKNIHITENLPTTWIDYQKRAVVLDGNFRRGQQARTGKSMLFQATPQMKSQTYGPCQQPQAQQPQYRQPVRDPYAMEVDVTRTTAANLTPPPRPKIAFSLDAEGRVIGGREQLMAAGACHYCKKPGHIVKTCPVLAERDACRGGYTPLQRPANFVARNRETMIASSSVSGSATGSRIISPVSTYEATVHSQLPSASVSTYEELDLGFVSSCK
jgi:hypothetical protein